MQVLTKSNSEIINEYFEALQTEINPSVNYIIINRNMLTKFSGFFGYEINFKDMTREHMLSYLNSLRKSEDEDPLHKWIGTYNLYVTKADSSNGCTTRYWLLKRPKPELLNNIPIPEGSRRRK